MGEKIIIAKILRPQGIKGELKLNVFTDDFENFSKIKEVYLTDKFNSISVEKVRISGSDVFVNFENIIDRNQAELLRGLDVYIDRESLPQLGADTFYICDLIGCEVYDDADNCLGKLTDVLTDCGGADVFVVKNKNKQQILFPYLASVVNSIDVENKKITVLKDKLNEVAVYED